jgi:hypothetical protein
VVEHVLGKNVVAGPIPAPGSQIQQCRVIVSFFIILMLAYLRHPAAPVVYWLIGIVTAVLAAIWLIPSAGTGDVGVYEQIIENFRRNGIAQLSTCITVTCPGHTWNYPPLYLVILFLGQLVGGSLLDNFSLHKMIISLFYGAAMGALAWFSYVTRPHDRSPVRSIIRGLFLGFTGLALLLNSYGLGYIDVYMYPFIILCFVFLHKENYLYSGFLFACGFLMKWMPILMLPLILLYLLRRGVKSLGLFLLGVSIPVLTTGLLSWGYDFVSDYLRGASAISNDPYFAASPTLPWLYTMIFPQQINGLPDSLLIYLDASTKTPAIMMQYTAFKFAFLGYYAWVLYTFHRIAATKRTLRPLLVAATYAYLGYFFIASGVHENHLMIGVLCALLLSVMSVRHERLYRSVDGMSAISMLLFYGVSGTPFFPVEKASIAYPLFVTVFLTAWFIALVMQFKKQLASA